MMNGTISKKKNEIDDQIISAVKDGTGDDLSRLLDRKKLLTREAIIAESRSVREAIARAEKRRKESKEELKRLDATIAAYAEDARHAQDIANLKIRRVQLAEIQAYGLQGESETLFEDLSNLRRRLNSIVNQLIGNANI